MSTIAIFRLSCCNREIAHGRSQGSDMYPPLKRKCPFGCPNKKNPRGKPEPHVLHFDRYEFDDTISLELLKTDSFLFKARNNPDPWYKYERIRQEKRKDMNMNIKKANGDFIKTALPQQFVPFRSGLAGQKEKHAEALQVWVEQNINLKTVYLGVQDGCVYLDEVQR